MAINLPILRYFTFEHLPPKLKEQSAPFCNLATLLVESYREGDDIAELVVALRKLLEAKDAAVRSVVSNGSRP